MIVLFRVDDRLLHGQVARSWTKQYRIQKIVIINNEIMNDEFSKMTLCLAKPQNVDLVFTDRENSKKLLQILDETDERVMCIVNGFEDAMFVLPSLPAVCKVNVGGLRSKTREPGIVVNHLIVLDANDEQCVKELIEKGYQLEVQQIPEEMPINLEDVIL